jgi:23S rRNA-intervening sequence protein
VKAYDFVLWLLPKAESFSRAYRFTLGERVVSGGLDLLLALVEAAYTTNKAGLLQRANGQVNGLRYLLRLAKDLRLLTVDSYTFAAERLEEIGRMVGGWQRSMGKRT